MKLSNLQILRFIAAGLVLFSHVQHQALKLFTANSSFNVFEPIYWAGGVDIFFVISGFIMYYIASDKFGARGATFGFLLKRLARIAPPYWLFTVLMVISTVLFAKHISHPNFSFSLLLSSLFFIPKMNSYGLFYPVLMLGWTLNFEFFFYIVFSIGLLFKRKFGVVLIVLMLLMIASLKFVVNVEGAMFEFYSNPIIFEFVFGIFLAMCFLSGFRLPLLVSVCVVLLSIVLMVTLKSAGIASNYWSYRFLWMGLPALLLCSGFVLSDVKDNNSSNGIRDFLSFMGDASYSLYLSHPFSLNLIALLWVKCKFGTPWLYVGISCFFSLLCAVFVYLWIEKPLVGFSSRLLSVRSQK